MKFMYIIISGARPLKKQNNKKTKNGTVDTVDFQDFTLIISYHQIWLRAFYFMSNFLWTVIFGICPIFRDPRHD